MSADTNWLSQEREISQLLQHSDDAEGRRRLLAKISAPACGRGAGST
jgi:hypothetical protein